MPCQDDVVAEGFSEKFRPIFANDLSKLTAEADGHFVDARVLL